MEYTLKNTIIVFARTKDVATVERIYRKKVRGYMLVLFTSVSTKIL